MTDPLFGIGSWLAHVAYVLLVGIGLFVLVNDENLVKKVIGLNIFQTGVFLFFITSAYRADGTAPLVTGEGPFVNPLPQVLILTAIVVGVSVTAVALSLVVRLYNDYGTLREDVIREVRRGTGGTSDPTTVADRYVPTGRPRGLDVRAPPSDARTDESVAGSMDSEPEGSA